MTQTHVHPYRCGGAPAPAVVIAVVGIVVIIIVVVAGSCWAVGVNGVSGGVLWWESVIKKE